MTDDLLMFSGTAKSGIDPMSYTVDQLLAFRGAFCVPDVFPKDEAKWFGDGKRIWTPAFGCYADPEQNQIIAALKARGYTHVPYNLSGLPYGDDYPYLHQDPERIHRDLTKLWNAGMIPLCFLYADNGNPTLSSIQPVIDRCGTLLRLWCWMWECNMVVSPGVDHWDGSKWVGVIGPSYQTLNQMMPWGVPCIHFTPEHGSGGDDEPKWWLDFSRGNAALGIAPNTVKCLLAQDNHWDDPAWTARGVESTAVRLNGTQPGWQGCQAATVAFEQQTTVLYHGPRTEAEGIAFTEAMLPICPSITGWCDVGPKS